MATGSPRATRSRSKKRALRAGGEARDVVVAPNRLDIAARATLAGGLVGIHYENERQLRPFCAASLTIHYPGA